ncbi:ATP-binding protein [Dyadobacter arcticus]|uniref:histidine kinase n=1 Tax=Dyadobacter arcticus TaxID=1078754 RepID=A0ABX0URH4_9BACT|nr:ATP-binding protein [Dyadobacter arcticus]NIJ54215.1 signal transduction histidine kinase/DNA-binding response OmpR family regulator [Dyadobacter arcticus]
MISAFLLAIKKKTFLFFAVCICMTALFFTPGYSQLKSVEGLKTQLSNHEQEDTIKVNLLNELSYQDQWYNFYGSLAYAEKALQIAERLYYKKGISIARHRIAHCYWALGDSDLSIDQALKSANIAVKERFYSAAGESYRILAINYRDQQDLAKAHMYIQKAEQAAVKCGNFDLLSRVYNTWGVIEYTQNEDELALARYTKSLAIVESHHTLRFHLSQVYSNIGEMYAKEKYNDPKLESYYYEKALSVARNTRNRSAEAAILNSIAKTLIRKNRFAEANEYLNQSLTLARELNVKRIIKNILLTFIDLKVRQGKSVDALEYVEKYYAVRDSLLNEKKTRQIVEMETRFDTEKKEQMILFLEQQKQIQTIWTNIWIIGSLFLLTAIVLVYRLHRLRARKAKQMLDVQTELNNKLKETDQLKSRFFANISHEFRTPLSLILAPVEEMITSSSLLISDKNNLRMVRRNANRLLDLVNQLLDLSKIDAGKMKLQMQGDGLQNFLQVLVASFDSFAESRLIHFSKSIQVPSRNAWFDRDKLEKIISNILSNAFNFTGAGGFVTLSIQVTNDFADMLIEVTDTGKGIPAEDLPHVFSPFYQTRRMTDDSQPGSGLGLTLVAELVKLHKGKINLKSELNVGTTISITLPFRKEDLDFEEVMSVAPAKLVNPEVEFNEYITGKAEVNAHGSECILIVEDNKELRSFIASCFDDDFRILQAEDGEEGLKLAIEKVPDLIISDVMMPKMDGVILTEKLKTDDRTSHIPVMLLTAKTNADSRMDGYRSGADDYLAKPFSTEELRVRVANLIELRKKLASKYRRNLLAPAEPNKMVSLDDKFMINLSTLIEVHLSDPSFGVEQLAEEMCMSRTQLFRKVKALTDISPNELINDIRLQRAAEMIRFKADSLTQISYAVGYNEQSYFAKRFKRKFGVSPSEYANP